MTLPLETPISPQVDAEPASDASQGPVQPSPDPFDPAALRLDQSFETPSVKKLLTTVPVRKKPVHQQFVRVHPGADFRGNFALIEFGEDREFYLVHPLIARELLGEFHPYTLYTAVTRQEKAFLWAIRMPDPDGRQLEWHRSKAEAALLAQRKWIRITADTHIGAYEISEAETTLSEPVWPEGYSFHDLLKIAFKNRFVDSLDHLIIKKLRGLA
jgi:hypothetical protein